MMITMGIAIGAGTARGDGGGVGGPVGTVTVSDFVGDRPIFDSGAALGLSSAPVPLSGTGTPGAGIELRAVTEAGAPVTAWVPAQVDGSGAWSAEIDVPLASGWLAAQARVQGAAGPQSQGGLFGVGHVIALWQQSEHHHLILSVHNQTAAPVLAAQDEGRVRMTWARGPSSGDGTIREAWVTNDAGLTAGMVAMADTLARARPGELFDVIWHVQGGTSWNDLLDDDEPSRTGALDWAIHAHATRDGQHVGLAWASWYAAPRSYSTNYAATLLRMMFGVDSDGNAAPVADHERDFTQIYDYSRTRWLLSDPHRFDGTIAGLATIQGCRESVREGHTLAGGAGRLLPANIALTGYLNGEDDGAGGWTDWTHPAADDEDGIQRLARLTAGSALMGMGLLALDVPQIDMAEWQPDGSYMEMWDSAGPLTTERLARGLPALDSAAAGTEHRTEVMGITVGGAPAERAEIVAGRIRVYPPDGESFDASDFVRYGEGGGTGGTTDIAGDLRAGIHLNLPVRDAGIPGVPFVAALPLPETDVLENTILGGPVMFARSATGPAFRQDGAASGGTSIGAGRDALSLSFAFSVPDDPASKVANIEIIETTGFQFRLQIDMRSTKRSGQWFIKNSAGDNLGLVTFANGTFAYGATYEFRVSAAYATATEDGHFFLAVNDAVIADDVVAAGTVTGTIDGTRSIRYVNEANVPLSFGPLRVWWEADPSGALPAAAPSIHIGPGLADVNAHPWKQGADAT